MINDKLGVIIQDKISLYKANPPTELINEKSKFYKEIYKRTITNDEVKEWLTDEDIKKHVCKDLFSLE